MGGLRPLPEAKATMASLMRCGVLVCFRAAARGDAARGDAGAELSGVGGVSESRSDATKEL